MNILQDSRRAALNLEEAALLPAMPRKNVAGSAALQTALRSAQAMEGKKTGNAVDAASLVEKPASAQSAASRPAPLSRAALHHALQRRMGSGAYREFLH